MKNTALLIAALMIGGSALAQTASTSDPYDTTPDNAVSADTTVETEMDATTGTTVDTDMDATADSTLTTSTTATGVGGPYVAPTEVTSKGDYPPCDPGPGDDMCIQLYERGVSTQTNLAMNRNLGSETTMMASADTTTWTNEVGTSATTGTAVGGPYEPVAVSTPESRTEYPPCNGAESDDNCIQLYERGVTRD